MKHLKQEFDKLTIKEFISYFLAVATLTASTVAIFLSLYISPEGEVHPSVLTYFGMSGGLCGAILGITTHYSSELAKFKATIIEEINKKQEEICE